MSNDRESSGAVLVDPLGGLLLDPSNELRFKGPFDDYVTVSLTIRNPTEKRIAFKIKTTAPKRYCVKPNSGVLDPAQSMKVNVLLQPFVYDPNEKNKHKFMVQYLYLNDQEIQLSVNEILNMWKDVEAKRLLDLKLKCIFDYTDSDMAKKQNDTAANADNHQSNDANNTSTISTYSNVDTTKRESLPAAAPAPTPATTTIASTAAVAKPTVAKQEIHTDSLNDFESKPKTAPVSEAVTRTASEKNDNLSNELKMLQRENDALKIEVANLREAEIRLRKLALSSASSTSGKQPVQAFNLSEFLQNRLVLVISVLVAIIFYLLLFR